MKTELLASGEFTLRRIYYAGVELWTVYNPEGYFCGSYFNKADAEAFLASRNVVRS